MIVYQKESQLLEIKMVYLLGENNMRLFYKRKNDIVYVYKGILNYKLNRYNKKLTKELINKHDKSYINNYYLDSISSDLHKSYYLLYKYDLPNCNRSEKNGF